MYRQNQRHDSPQNRRPQQPQQNRGYGDVRPAGGGGGGRDRTEKPSPLNNRPNKPEDKNHGRPPATSHQQDQKTEKAPQDTAKPLPEKPKEEEANNKPQNCKLFVGNLINTLGNDEFRKVFEPHGEITDAFVCGNKGFGFVTFKTREQAEKARAALDGTLNNKRKLRISFATEPKPKQPPPQAPPPSQQQVMQQFGQNPYDSYGYDDSQNPEQTAPKKKYTGRCRLFIGNLPSNLSEEEFRQMFSQFGVLTDVFYQKQRTFAFIKYETRAQAEAARSAVDGMLKDGRRLQVKFASSGTSLKVTNLTPWVSNELLEEAFSGFGDVERAVVIVDSRGRPTGEGIVEFEKKQAAQVALRRCSQGCLLLTRSAIPVTVEPLEVRDDEDGFAEKNFNKNNPDYQKERELGPRFAEPGSFEYEFATKWKRLLELEKQKKEFLEREIQDDRRKLEDEVEFYRFEYETNMLRQQLRMYEEQNQYNAREREMKFGKPNIQDEQRMQQQMMLNQLQDQLRKNEAGFGRLDEGSRLQGGGGNAPAGSGGPTAAKEKDINALRASQDGGSYTSTTFDKGMVSNEYSSGSIGSDNRNAGVGGRRSRFDQGPGGPFTGGRDDMDSSGDPKRRRY